MARKKSKAKQAAAQEEQLGKLDRFAGSSEEEEDDDGAADQQQQNDGGSDDAQSSSSAEEEHQPVAKAQKPVKRKKPTAQKTPVQHSNKRQHPHDDDGHFASPESNDEPEGDDDDSIVGSQEGQLEDNIEEPAELQLTTGLANAMTRILASSQPRKKHAATAIPDEKNVILSKTKTPLQIQAAKEKVKQKALKDQRQVNRERRLAALHVPLSIATSRITGDSTGANNNNNNKSISSEMEQERKLRRVATRGIVALFNAIAQHQQPQQQAAAAATKESKKKDGKSSSGNSKLTKDGFLEKIKQSAAAKAAKTTENPSKTWNALKDDFMMDSKKNWDDEDSSSEEEKDGGDNSKGGGPPKKKQRHKARS